MRTAAVVGWGVVALWSATLCAQRPAPPKASPREAAAMFDRLYQAYASGDHAVVVSQVNTLDACRRIQPALVTSTKTLLTPENGVPNEWRRDKAAFVLELANDLSQCASKELVTLLSEGRAYVMGRPTLLTANASDDAFELQWHLIAEGILQRERALDFADVYLDTLERRYVTGQSAKAANASLDPRFMLMRATNAEQRALATRPGGVSTPATPAALRAVDASQPAGLPSSFTISTAQSTAAVGGRQEKLRGAARLLDEAAAIGTNAPESFVRLAAVRYQLNQFEDALAAVNRAAVPSSDRPLAYWAGLWKGRILDAMNRPADAEAAYASALDAWPTGQAAGVGVALMRFKQNHRAEAREAALRVQAMPAGAPDPWWGYSNGAERFVGPWLVTLRGMLQ
jgi:tetratricopeptide (TPR) repeat protein